MAVLQKSIKVVRWSLLFVCFFLAAAQGGSIPGIVVAPDGHSFQTETGRAFVAVWCDVLSAGHWLGAAGVEAI